MPLQKNESVNLALEKLDFFTEKFQEQAQDALGILPLFTHFYYHPSQFAACLTWAVSNAHSPQDIIQSFLLHHWIAYHAPFLHEEDNEVRTTFMILQEMSVTYPKLEAFIQAAENSACLVEDLHGFTLTGEDSRDFSRYPLTKDLRLVPTEANLTSLYQVFGATTLFNTIFIYLELAYFVPALNSPESHILPLLKKILHKESPETLLSYLSPLIHKYFQSPCSLVEELAVRDILKRELLSSEHFQFLVHADSHFLNLMPLDDSALAKLNVVDLKQHFEFFKGKLLTPHIHRVLVAVIKNLLVSSLSEDDKETLYPLILDFILEWPDLVGSELDGDPLLKLMLGRTYAYYNSEINSRNKLLRFQPITPKLFEEIMNSVDTLYAKMRACADILRTQSLLPNKLSIKIKLYIEAMHSQGPSFSLLANLRSVFNDYDDYNCEFLKPYQAAFFLRTLSVARHEALFPQIIEILQTHFQYAQWWEIPLFRFIDIELSGKFFNEFRAHNPLNVPLLLHLFRTPGHYGLPDDYLIQLLDACENEYLPIQVFDILKDQPEDGLIEKIAEKWGEAEREAVLAMRDSGCSQQSRLGFFNHVTGSAFTIAAKTFKSCTLL